MKITLVRMNQMKESKTIKAEGRTTLTLAPFKNFEANCKEVEVVHYLILKEILVCAGK